MMAFSLVVVARPVDNKRAKAKEYVERTGIRERENLRKRTMALYFLVKSETVGSCNKIGVF